MPFDDNGFLGDQVLELSRGIVEKHQAYFDICYEINRLVEKTKLEFLPNKHNRQEVISACLYIKFIEGVQAAIILVKLGLDADAQIILRSSFETLIHLVLCTQDEDASHTFLIRDHVNRLKTLKKARKRNDKDGVWADLKTFAEPEVIEELEEEIKISGFDPDEFYRENSIKKLANKAKLNQLYDSFYTVVSDYVHTNPRALERYVAIDSEGNIDHLIHMPRDDHAQMNLSAAAEFSLVALSAMCKLFDVDKNSELEIMRGKVLTLD